MPPTRTLTLSDETPRTASRDPAAAWVERADRAHAKAWSQATPNPLALLAAIYCGASLLPWAPLFHITAGGRTSIGVLLLLLPLPLIGAVLGGVAYKRAVPPVFRGRFVAAATLFAHGVYLSFLGLSLAYAGTTEPANRLRCAANLRQIGQSLVFYAVKYDAHYPPTLATLVVHGDMPAAAFVCPSSPQKVALGTTLEATAEFIASDPTSYCSYVYAAAPLSADAVTLQHVLAYEPPAQHGGTGAHFLFGNGSVRWLDQPEADRFVAELSSGHNPPRPH